MISLGGLLLIFITVFMLIPGAVAIVYFIVTLYQQGALLPPKILKAKGWRRAKGGTDWHYTDQCSDWPMTEYEEIEFVTQLKPEPLCRSCRVIKEGLFRPTSFT